MQIGPADSGRCHLNDRNRAGLGFQDRRRCLHANVVFAVPSASARIISFSSVQHCLGVIAAVAISPGFHQLLEAAEVAPHLNCRVHAGRSCAMNLANRTASRWIIAGSVADHDRAAFTGIAETQCARCSTTSASSSDAQAMKLSRCTSSMTVRIPFHRLAGGCLDQPNASGFSSIDIDRATTFSMKVARFAKIAPISEQLGQRTVDRYRLSEQRIACDASISEAVASSIRIGSVWMWSTAASSTRCVLSLFGQAHHPGQVPHTPN